MKIGYLLPQRSSLSSIVGVVETCAGSPSGIDLPRINVTTINVTGTANFSNSTNATSSTTAPVTFGGGIGVASDIYASKIHSSVITGTVYLPTVSGTPSPLNYYEEKTFGAIEFTGVAPITGNCYATRVGRLVNLTFTTSAASAATAASVLSSSTGVLSPTLRPSADQTFSIPVYNNSTASDGNVIVGNDGTITFCVSPISPFSNSGNAGILATSVSYSI